MMKYASFLSLTGCLMTLGCSESPAPSVNQLADVAPPSAQERIERGKYLVGIMGCGDCHSPKIMGPQGPVPDRDRILSGFRSDGQLPPVDPKATAGWALFSMDLTAAVGPWGTTYAANITSDETGIGNWTEEQFARALRKGLYKGIEGSRPLLPPMPWQNYVNMTDEDLKNVFTYLKSTKPVNNVVPPPVPPGGK